jgi:hypothetical protein
VVLGSVRPKIWSVSRSAVREIWKAGSAGASASSSSSRSCRMRGSEGGLKA